MGLRARIVRPGRPESRGLEPGDGYDVLLLSRNGVIVGVTVAVETTGLA